MIRIRSAALTACLLLASACNGGAPTSSTSSVTPDREPPASADDARAIAADRSTQANLRLAIAIAHAWVPGSGDYSSATPEGLRLIDETLTLVEGDTPSTHREMVSMYADQSGIAFAALSDSGPCFWIKAIGKDDVAYGMGERDTCTGRDASEGATEAYWPPLPELDPSLLPPEVAAAREAQVSLRNTFVAAVTVYADAQTYTEADVATLAEFDPSITFVDSPSPSTGPQVVSIFADGPTVFAAAALADDGRCFWIRDDAEATMSEDGDGLTAGTGTQETCTGEDAASASESLEVGWEKA